MKNIQKGMRYSVFIWFLLSVGNACAAGNEKNSKVVDARGLLNPTTSSITFDIADYYIDFSEQEAETPSKTLKMEAGWLQTSLSFGASESQIVDDLLKNITMPDSLKTALHGIKSFSTMTKSSGPTVLGQNSYAIGTVEYADGTAVQAKIIQIAQTTERPAGFALLVELPTHIWKPSQFNAELHEFDSGNYIAVVTTFPFSDAVNIYAVDAGVTIVGGTELKTVVSPTSLLHVDLENVNEQFDIKSAVLTLGVSGKAKDAVFRGQLKNLSTSDIKLSDIVKPSDLKFMQVPKEISDKAGKVLLSGVSLKNSHAHVEFRAEHELLMVTGKTMLWGKTLSAQVGFSKAPPEETERYELENKEHQSEQRRVVFQVQLLKTWKVSDIIPQLASSQFNFEFEGANVIVSSIGDDELQIRSGLRFEGMLPFEKLPNNFVTDSLRALVGKDKKVKAIAFVAIKQEGESFFDYGVKILLPLAGSKDLKIGDLLQLNPKLVSQALINEINKIAIKDATFVISLENTQQNAMLESVVAFNGYDGVKARVSIFHQSENIEIPEGAKQQIGGGQEEHLEAASGISLTLAMPENKWKISDSIKELKFLDSLNIEKGALVISQSKYYDFDLRERISPGLTILADIFLEGKLAPLQKLYESTLGAAATAAEKKKPFRFKGEVNPVSFECSLQMRLPGKLKFDFKNMDVIKEGISSIALKDFIFAVGRDGTGIAITGGATADIATPFTKTPLEQQMIIGVESTGSFIIEMRRSDMEFNFVKWLKFERSGIKLKIMPPGLPTDIEVRGGLSLANIAMNAALKVGKDGWAINGEIDKLSLDSLIGCVETMAGKTTHVPNIPALAMNKVKVYIVPVATEIAGVRLSPGINIQGDIDILNQKAQLQLTSIFTGKQEWMLEKLFALVEGIHGSVVLKEINIKDAFIITGTGLPSTANDGTFIKGPMFVVNVGISQEGEQKVELDGMVKILNIANAHMTMRLATDGFILKSDMDLLGAKGTIDGKITAKGLDAQLQIKPAVLPYITLGTMQGQLVINKDVQSGTLAGTVGLPFMGTSMQAKIMVGSNAGMMTLPPTQSIGGKQQTSVAIDTKGVAISGDITVLGGLTHGTLAGTLTQTGLIATADLAALQAPISMTNARLSITATDKEQRGVIDALMGLPLLKTSVQTQIMLDSKSGGTFTLHPSIIGMSGTIQCAIDKKGVTGSGELSPLINPMLSITSSDGKTGPLLSLSATQDKQAASVTGQVALTIPGLQVSARQALNLNVSAQGFSLAFANKIFGLFDAAIVLSGATDMRTFDANNVTLDITLKQSATDVLKNELTKFADVFKKNVDSATDAMRKELIGNRDALKQRLEQKRKECGI